MAKTMKDVLRNLDSDKVKDRQEGLASLREVFSRDKVVATFHIKRDGSADPETWSVVFRALFKVARTEEAVAKKKYSSKAVSTTAALRRLSEAASVVRWLIERTVHLMNMKVLKECIEHLTRLLHNGDDVFGAVALDYSKALRCIVGHPPHLEHLNPNLWCLIASISFNVTLGDPIDALLGDEDEMEVPNDIDSDMYVDESAEDTGENPKSPASHGKGKKRSRVDSIPEPILSPQKSQKPMKQKRKTVVSVSLEQVEFVSILRILIAAPTAPLLHPNLPFLPSAILQRLQRFLELYPADSSLLRDYLSILSSALDHLSLNKKREVENFALSTWDGLLNLWGTKDKTLKEGLLVVIRHLFHFLTSPPATEEKLPKFDWVEGIGHLWNLLDAEAENRWGVDGLSLDALRLEILGMGVDDIERGDNPFVAKTFRAGWNFDPGQVLSWAILELQADCAAKLFQFSESMHSVSTFGRLESKRMKLENPIASLLHSIQTKNALHVRSYHLQILLFFIDRHWSIVHDSLKEKIVNVLLQFVAYDDTSIQSWIFLNFAAIAFASSSRNIVESAPVLNSITWDSIWTHTIRRANVPGICRAACHAGYALLSSSQSRPKAAHGLVTYQRVLLEIETLMKDLDVQGPSYPFDSICGFLAQCMKIANQDVRLHRLHLEDKVLSWFVDNWKVVGNRTKMVQYSVIDVIHLLEVLCGLTNRAIFTTQVILPQTDIVKSMVEDSKIEVVRNFLLYAKLPSFNPNQGVTKKPLDEKLAESSVGEKPQLLPPRGRERKISSFFQRSLEYLAAEWDVLKDHNPTAEFARRSIDFALAAITFESLLSLNGTTMNRQVLQSAGRILVIIAPLLLDQRWILVETVLVAQAFEILVLDVEDSHEDTFHEALTLPGPYSGIKEQLLQGLGNSLRGDGSRKAQHVDFLRQIWQNVDFQEIICPVVAALRRLLTQLLSKSSHGPQEQSMDIDDKDEFGPIRTTTRQNSTGDTSSTDNAHSGRLLEICISFVTCGSFLQSSSGKATRDQDLIELIIGSSSNPASFCAACPIFFNFVRQKIIHLPLKNLNRFLDKFAEMLEQYSFSKSQSFVRVIVHFLGSTFGIWKLDDESAREAHSKCRDLYAWLSIQLTRDSCRSWTLRDAIARFLGQYLMEDPTQASWATDEEFSGPTDDSLAYRPTSLLPKLSTDQDIRVRFRAAVINSGLFAISHHTQQSPFDLYDLMKSKYTVDVDSYEHMLTRLLAIGNVLVVSSAVRRGAYWNVLETCLFTDLYSSHIEAILIGVSQMLGMASLANLFEAYASQLAYSLRQADADFMRFPPHLLGYRDRKECAEATFRSFTPTNILIDGEKLFKAHCDILQKDPISGLHDCLGDVVGFHIVTWMNDPSSHPDQFDQFLNDKLKFARTSTPLPFERNLDEIITMILRSLGDQDFSSTGPIASALEAHNPSMIPAYQALIRHRDFDPLRTHTPNLPAFRTTTILRSLVWLSTHWGGFNKHTTYHVLYELVKELHRTPLVNEQTRLINAMTLWISYRQEDFTEPTIADTLIHGAVFFLSQSDLARAAQSMLEWVFGRYPPPSSKVSWKESRLPNMIIRIRGIAHDYCSDSANTTISELGRDLARWLDNQMAILARKATHRGLIHRILPTWPQQPSSGLAKLYDEISTIDLLGILGDHRITSNKFRLVRRLQERASAHDHDENTFSKMSFWRLKECIPTVDRLQEEDVHAFAMLLTLSRGHIGSLTVEQPNMLSRHRHRLAVKKRSAEDTVAARDAVTVGLLAMLGDDDPVHVFSAYDTLRLTMADQSHDDPLLVIPAVYRMDMDFLKEYLRRHIPRVSPDMFTALKSESYLETLNCFPKWVSLVTTLFSDALASVDAFFGQLSSILSSDIEFAEQILPILVHAMLQVERAKKTPSQPLREAMSTYFTTVLLSPKTDICCVRAVVDVVLHLRYFSPLEKTDALAYDKWLAIDFALLARSAIMCGAYTTALLFVELASEHKVSSAQDRDTEQVLYEIYAHIDEPDGFYGIKTQDLHQFLIKRFHHEKQWDKAFRFHGAALEAGSPQDGEQAGLLESFHSFGFDHLAIDTLRNRESSSNQPSSSMSYKLGWRTETWDLPDQTSDATSGALYRSLRAIYRERDPHIIEATIRSSLYDEISHLKSLGAENLAEIRMVSRDLMCLNEILQWRRDNPQELQAPDAIVEDKLRNFADIDSGFDFADLEPIMATRIALVRSVRQREEKHQLGTFITSHVQRLLDIEKSCLLRVSNAARASGQIQLALNSVVRAQRLDQNRSPEVSEEFANVLWLQKEEKPAVQFLQAVVENIGPSTNPKDLAHHALLLSRLGTWTSEAFLEKPTEVWERYFSKAISILDAIDTNGHECGTAKATVFRECAMFAEHQYHATLKSPDAIRYKVYVDRKRHEIEHRSKEIARTQSDVLKGSLEREQAKAQRLLQTDSELFRKHITLRETLLKHAIDMHSRCLETSSAFDDDSAIRLCSLWFANFDDESILDAVRIALERTPSRKLVFLAHQITARVSTPPDGATPKSQENLQRLVVRMCQEHPFHSLYQVYCISDHTSGDSRRLSGRFSQSTQTERGSAANDILNRLRNDETSGTRVRDVERLCDAGLEWAKLPIVNNQIYKKRPPTKEGYDIPSYMKILRINAASLKVPVPTARTNLDTTLKYDNCNWIHSYIAKFNTAGGVNMPKISICLDTDKNQYKQLFKGEGNDDMRQDAVMEQVFYLVNTVLSRDRETRRRDLWVRDYKVIPLASQAGLLEFVENTIPLKDWLHKAHINYHPTDMRSDEFTTKLKAVQAARRNQHDKQLEFFLAARKRFRPVMRHYFTEKHRTPINWFQMRLKYTRSVATTSIVGHVLGLGDRHVSNILLDNVSGEVVHIDLGIAFDQGKLLTVPERVPFRMTADMVDGMGTSGTAGVFQRCAEETLRVLREESGVIMTVLEVFKHDPLHSWTASEVKVKQAQSDAPTTTSILQRDDTNRFNNGIGIDMTSGSADEAADRALSSVARKLDKSLSVESTVNELIAEATDPMNLATIFYGWSPHM